MFLVELNLFIHFNPIYSFFITIKAENLLLSAFNPSFIKSVNTSQNLKISARFTKICINGDIRSVLSQLRAQEVSCAR